MLIVGDDDLILNDAIKTVLKLLNQYKIPIIFLLILSFKSTSFKNYKSPINPSLIKEKMSKFSNKLNDFDVILLIN